MSNSENTIQRGGAKKSSVLYYTIGIFLFLTSFLFAIDFVPERTVSEAHSTKSAFTVSTDSDANPSLEARESVTDEYIQYDTNVQAQVEYVPVLESNIPTQIVIESIGVHTPIVSPATSDVAVLDRALQIGAVHYPNSGTLGENANMLIFGHSSHLPVVRNSAYKAFNEINTLNKGDEITVRSESHEYIYKVMDVSLLKADDARVYFESDTPMLTLATCDNFGSEEDRWVVTARLASKKQFINS